MYSKIIIFLTSDSLSEINASIIMDSINRNPFCVSHHIRMR